jgi:hypothetical protein
LIACLCGMGLYKRPPTDYTVLAGSERPLDGMLVLTALVAKIFISLYPARALALRTRKVGLCEVTRGCAEAFSAVWMVDGPEAVWRGGPMAGAAVWR